jgi:simple sugar transport system permease protein
LHRGTLEDRYIPTAKSSPTSEEQIARPTSPRVDEGRARATGLRRTVGYVERFLTRREAGPIFGLIILAAIFQLISGAFLSTDELTGLVTLSAPLAIVSVGVAFLMISGEFDLSVGGVYPLAPILLGELIQVGLNEWLSFLLTLVACASCGLVNGFITTRFRIPSFITTLAVLFILRGVAFIITNGQTVLLSNGSPLFSILGGTIGKTFVSAPLLWAIGITAAMWFLLQHTRYGNWTFAAGGRTDAPRAMGVPSTRVKSINFVISSTLAGFAGCAQFASFGGASPGNGDGYELLAIVACVVGGTSLYGVRGTVVGAFIGALTLGALQTGLVLIGMPGEVYTSLIGVILIAAVILNQRVAEISGLSRRLPLRRSATVRDKP